MQEKLEKLGAEFIENPNEVSENNKYTKEQINKIKDEIYNSSLIVGIKPITPQHIHNETVKIIKEGRYNKKKQKQIK